MFRTIFSRCNYLRYFRIAPKVTFNRKDLIKPVINKPTRFVIAFSLTGLLGGGAKELNPEDEMVMAMKRGILSIQRKEFNKAEQILHIALGMAEKQNNQNAITYIYDLMANLAMERNEPNKAKKLFVNVLQRLLENGVSENDLKVIHISVKVANIHAQMGYLDEAEIGYKWCLEKLNSTSDDEDSILLRGITLDHYAQILCERKQYPEAMKCMKEAFTICTKIMGKNNEQTIKLLNDLASIYWKAGDLDNAEKYFKESISLTGNDNPFLVGVLKSNLGILLLEKGMIKEAEIMCKDAWHIGTASKENSILNQANYCLNEINKVYFSK